MSRYTNFDIAYKRLSDEFDKYGNIIVAFDVDSTVLPFHPDEKPEEYDEIRSLLAHLYIKGCTLIVFTAANESRWDEIKEKLNKINIKYHYFNESPPNIPGISKTGKVYANIYLDDRAGLDSTVKMLKKLIKEKL